MGSPLPPDPYLALGVPKTADQAAIKTAHRKLVLKCHPDKVADPQAKQAASDQFHKIQTAYEILVDQDRRERYDAQVRLAELRKEALERQGGKSSRGADRPTPSAYKSSQESSAPRGAYSAHRGERPGPQYEERRPAYASDYFDPPPRATARKESEYERSSRRPASDSKEKTRAAREAREKELERERRRERARRADQDARKDRDRKASAAYIEDDSDSEEDDYVRRARKMKEEDSLRREAEQLRRAREEYSEQAYKQGQQAASGHFEDARTKKMFAATSSAWDHIRASGGSRQKAEAERRPSPVRQSSSKDKFDYVKGKDGRPVVVRRGSQRPQTSGRGSERRSPPREQEPARRSSAETMDDLRRPPTLNQTRSSPTDIRIPEPEKQRAQSVQMDKDTMPDIPQVRRAETMPHRTSRQSENTVPQRGRPTEFNEGLATPAPTPEYPGQSASNSTKFNYGSQYADDKEFPTPDGYRTEVRQPPRPTFGRKITRSPSPVKETRETRDARDSRERDRQRTTSSRYPTESPRPGLPNTRTTSYVYTPAIVEQLERSRPNSGRAVDSRDPRGGLYGEIRPTSGSPRQKYSAYDEPEEPGVRYQRNPPRTEEMRGYGYRKPSADVRPGLSRTGSSGMNYTSVRA